MQWDLEEREDRKEDNPKANYIDFLGLSLFKKESICFLNLEMSSSSRR